MSDCSFDFNEIQGTGTFNFKGDDDFDLDPIDGFDEPNPILEEAKDEVIPALPLDQPDS